MESKKEYSWDIMNNFMPLKKKKSRQMDKFTEKQSQEEADNRNTSLK